MKKFTLLSAVFVFSFYFAFAQTVQVSSGQSYLKQTFYSITNNASSTINNTEWDIAFTVFGQQDAGVFLNEAAGTGTPPQVPLKLFRCSASVYADVTEASILKDSLYNNELGWSYGAFNAERNPTDPFDYGWGAYNPGSNKVEGKKVYVLKLRDGSLRKIELQNLNLTVYTFRHSKLDGSDEKIVTIDKTKYPGKTMAYYSFSKNEVKDLEPAGGFDLLYTRYSSTVVQNDIPTLYPVLGILTGRGIQAVKATGVDPAKVNAQDYATKFEKRADVIGYDWKSFSLTTNTWTIPTDLAYFVKLRNGDVWKLVFIDFEGSATGITTFEKTFIGKVTASNDNIGNEISLKVFPTAVNKEINVAFDNKNSERFTISIFDMNGRNLQVNQIDVKEGFQVNTIDVGELSSGTYLISLQSAKGISTSKFIKL
ncbi:MAG: T9SS type A sorting domain-containing protein [Saprospiraceae bacterium]